MNEALAEELRDQGRGITGALLVAGLSFLYTMETWWLGWRLPLLYLLVYAFVGLAAVFVVTRNVGFRREEEAETQEDLVRVAANFAELVLQSFVAAYVVLLAFGVVEVGDPPIDVVRLGLIQVVPLGLGAAVANRLLRQSETEVSEASFPRNLPTFAFGAAFVTFPVAPTQEVEVIALNAGWFRLAALVVLSVAVVYVVLYELQFRGHRSRIEDRSRLAQVGSAFVAYGVGAVVAVAMLVSFGHFAGTTVAEWVQQTIVLSFLASIGASAGEVVL